MKKRLVAFLLVLIMVLGMLPVSALAADGTIVYDGVTLYTNTKPRHFTFLRNNAEGNVTKDVGESGVYQRLPRYTNICSCGRTLVECIPDEYSANAQKTVELSDPTVLKDLSFTISGWSNDDFYSGAPCLTFNFTAAKPGTTNVKLTFYYNYNFEGASGRCKSCGRYANIPAMNTWLQETTTFTVTVTGDSGEDEKPDVTVTYTLNYHAIGGDENSVPASQTEKSNTGKVTFTVSSKEPTRDGYKFLGWNRNPNDTTVTVKGGNTITTTAKVTNLYAVWEHVCVDKDKDGFCDICDKCMHDHDTDGYCTVDGCNHPHEGDNPCCPKPKEDPKPDGPRDPGEKEGNLVTVDCVTTDDHADATYGLIAGRYSVTDKKYDAVKGFYTCKVTVTAADYVSDYNKRLQVEHTLKNEADATLSFDMTWDKENEEWYGAGVIFEVKCEVTPPTDTFTVPTALRTKKFSPIRSILTLGRIPRPPRSTAPRPAPATPSQAGSPKLQKRSRRL